MKKIFKYLAPYTVYAILSPLLMAGEVMADLCLPKLMSVIVDCGISAGGDVSSSPLASAIMKILYGEGAYSSMQVIITFGVLMLVVVVLGGTLGVFCAYCAAKASQSLGNDLRCDAYRKVMSLSIEQTDKFTTGSLVTRMTNDITQITTFFEMLLRMFIRAPIFLIGGTVMLLTLNVSFGFVLICALPVMALMVIYILGRSVPLYSKIQKNLDRVNSVVGENVSGARVVKAYVKEEHEYQRFRSANYELMQNSYTAQKIMAIMQPILTVIMNAAIIAIIVIGGYDIANVGGSGMSAGTIMAAITYISQVLMSVMMISRLFQSVSRAFSSGKRVEELLDTEPSIVGGTAKQKSSDIEIELRNVSFRYPDTHGNPVLHDINLSIKKGERFAIIGATGSGKTTLVSLLPRFYDATEGEVLIGGVNVKKQDLTQLRQRISFVMQKSELFSDTIENNIRWGKDDATLDEIKEAAKIAQADNFISRFGDGYNTFIAEKGASLSGGQKQRMSIARALVRKPQILILDDATSALDLATEAKLQKELSSSLRGTTVVLIAQRIASVKTADRIAIIEDGTIKEIGTHEQLLATSQTYRDIYDSQNKNGGASNE